MNIFLILYLKKKHHVANLVLKKDMNEEHKFRLIFFTLNSNHHLS